MTLDDALDAFQRRWRAFTLDEAIERATTDFVGRADRLLPIDPTALAQKFGARVQTRPFRQPDGVMLDHGRLSVREKQWHVEVPVEMTAERRRFSIAHEIGHILLYDAVADQPEHVSALNARSSWQTVERICNQAAAQILIPGVQLRALIHQLDDPVETGNPFERLANQFYVSYEALARRIPEVFPGMTLIIWDWRLDHPRGPAWRTSKVRDRTGSAFVPDGMSSSRLRPDIVLAAAENGYATADTLSFDSPTIRKLYDAKAIRNRARRRPELDLHGAFDAETKQPDRVYLLGRIAASNQGQTTQVAAGRLAAHERSENTLNTQPADRTPT